MKRNVLWAILCLISIMSCNNTDDLAENNTPNQNSTTVTEDPNSGSNDDDNENTDSLNYKIMSLGDSYTVGQSVCRSCKFPSQLRDSIAGNIINNGISVEIIAQTGWTTSNLITAVNSQNLPENYDLVTLLIGVNNQFQSLPFETYEVEFPLLVNMAISLGNGKPSKVIVVSIPDYAFTPFGQNFTNHLEISQEIDQYNTFAENYCNSNNISFINITDITREGLINPDLVASDNLHPSEFAYTKFVERILPVALEKIE